MKGLDRLLWLCYGNHPKAGQQKEIAEDLVLVLRNENQMPRRELMDYLGFDPDDENEEQQFDRVLRKLRGDNELGIEAVTAFKAMYGDGREMHYSLSRNTFDASVRQAIKSIRYMLSDNENKRLKELAEKLPAEQTS